MSDREPGAHVPVLVVGIGNALRGDDGAGQVVARRVEALGLPDVQVRAAHQLLPELVVPVAAARRVVFVDAALGIQHVRVTRITPRATVPGPHRLEPHGLVGLAALLGLPVPEAFLVAVPVHDLTLGARLSHVTEQGVDAAVQIVRHLCVRHLGARHVDPPGTWSRPEPELDGTRARTTAGAASGSAPRTRWR